MQAGFAVLVKELAATMCRSPGPQQALAAAAQACKQHSKTIVYVGLAILARDKQSLQYTALYSSNPQAARLGALPTLAGAAGIAMETKQAVHVRDIGRGDLGLDDLQYFQQEHRAQTFFATAVVVAQTALGALCLAASEPNAFAGQERFFEVVAALCSPYLTLLKSQQEFLALEGLVTQMMPVRVALQLKIHQAQQQQQLQQTVSAASSTAGGAGLRSITGAGTDADDLPPVQLSAAVAGSSRFAARRAITTAAAAATAAAEEPAEQQGTGVAQIQQPSLHWQQQLQQQKSVMSLSMSFRQPQLEAAYRSSTSRQWQQKLDVLFMLLSVCTIVGPFLLQARLTGNAVMDGAFAVLPFLMMVVGSQRLASLPIAQYLALRQPCIAALRLVQALLFCYQSWQLPAQVFLRAEAAHGLVHTVVSNLSPAEKAGCGVLLMQGFMGQLPFVLHAAVQFVCAVLVFGELRSNPARNLHVGNATESDVGVLLQAFLGWVLPVVAVGFMEWRSRLLFLQKIN